MKAYSYDYNGIFIGEIQVELCQLTEFKKLEQSKRPLKEGELKIESVPLLPAHSTFIKPEMIENHFAIFKGNEWVYQEIPKKEEPEIIVPKELTYAEKRKREYPSVYEYIDGIVKTHSSDQDVHEEGVAQVEKYINDCLAIKAKYPKDK